MATQAELFRQAVQQAAGASNALTSATTETARANEHSSMKLMENLLLAQGADVTLAREREASVIATQEARQRARDAAGGESRMLDDIKGVVEGTDKVKALTQEVVRKQSRSILDIVSDPVGTITDMLTLDRSENELKGQIAVTSAQVLGTTQRYVALQQGFKEVNDVAIVSNAATMKAAADKAFAIQQDALIKAEIEGRKYNLMNLQTIQQMSVQQAEFVQKSISIENAEEAMRQSRQQMRLQEARFAVDMEERRRQAVERKEATGELEVVSSWIKQGMASANLTPPEGAVLRIHAKQALTNPNSPAAKYMSIGARNASIGPGSNMLGSTPSEGYGLINDLDIKPTAQMEAAVKLLNDAATLVNARVNRKADPKGWELAFDKQAKELADTEFTNLVPGGIADFGPHLSTYISSTPALMALPVTQKFIAPMVEAGKPISDPQALMKLGVAAVARGDITSDQLAGGMSAIYRQASLLHGETTRVRDLGIIPPKLGVMYNARLDGSRVNLTDYTELSRWVANHLGYATVQENRKTFMQNLPGANQVPKRP